MTGPPNARRPRAADVLRTFLALAAIFPGLLAGLAVLLTTRDRRRAINRAIDLWGRYGLAAAGVKLVVNGAEHLKAPRPAVFILNHQSGIDPILVCALLRRDLIGIAKREIRYNPLLGPAFAFAGVVFVDRFDHARALEALAPVIDRLREGFSVAIAPEGTRSLATEPGRFRKGAFHLAMAAGVPLIPIVIRDARLILPRGGLVMRAGSVHVVVHPPIDTRSWDPADLDRHIEEVRELYRRTLPTSTAP